MGKTKKAGLLARAVTCFAATIAIALGTASPAFAASEVTDSVDTSNISVTVPTTIPCLADYHHQHRLLYHRFLTAAE